MCSSLLAGSCLAIDIMTQHNTGGLLATPFLLSLDTTACLVTCFVLCLKSNSEYKVCVTHAQHWAT